jgi:hypothetical protein
METLPEPPPVFSLPPDVLPLAEGTEIWRIYNRTGPHPTAWNSLRFSFAEGRFDHQEPGEENRGILYATVGRHAVPTALAECFQYTRRINRNRYDPWLVSFACRGNMELLNMGGGWPLRAGGNMALNSGPREMSRRWSRVVYRSYPNIAGIAYPSSLTNETCLALYERALPCFPQTPTYHEPLASPGLFNGLTRIAERLGFSLE